LGYLYEVQNKPDYAEKYYLMAKPSSRLTLWGEQSSLNSRGIIKHISKLGLPCTASLEEGYGYRAEYFTSYAYVSQFICETK
jgi:hypothetical protein